MTDEKDVETVDNEAVVADLFARAEKDVIFAKALEAVVGGSPTGVLEDDDKALVEGYVAAHGVEHLVAHVERHNDYLAEQARRQAIRKGALDLRCNLLRINGMATIRCRDDAMNGVWVDYKVLTQFLGGPDSELLGKLSDLGSTKH